MDWIRGILLLLVFSGNIGLLRAQDTVLLLHGLGRGPGSLAAMERSLKEEGYLVINARYPSRTANIRTLAENVLSPLFGVQNNAATKIHVVTHSMGGLLVRQYIHDHGVPANLGRVVMLAPPNQGSELVDKLDAWAFYRWINGPAGLDLGTGPDQSPRSLGGVPEGVEVGVIAGSRSLNPIFSAIIPGVNDGKVSVARTHIEGEASHVILPYSHTWLMNRSKTKRQVSVFLATGRFEDAGLASAVRLNVEPQKNRILSQDAVRQK